MNPQQLHKESIIIDGLNASWFLNDGVMERLHAGGVTAVNATLVAWHNPMETMDIISQMFQQLDKHSDIAMQVRSVADIHAAKAANKVGFIFGFQDSEPIVDQLHLLRIYYELGVRIIQLTYNFGNLVGFGCQAPEDKGLTEFGRDAVAEMNRLGILIDLSHCGPQTTLEAIELSAQPVAITHSNASAKIPHPRNKSDEAIKACAAKGGVIGALSFPVMLTQNLPATIEDYVDAIDYLVQLVGVDHVAIGPDFMEEMPLAVVQKVLGGLPPEMMEEMKAMPPVQNFSTVAEMGNLTAVLSQRDYTTKEVQKIMGGNWLRLYQQVW